MGGRSDHTLPITDLEVVSSGDCAIAVTVSMDCTCQMWSVGAKVRLKSESLPCPLLSVAVERGQQSIFCGGNNGCIYEVSLVEVHPVESGHRAFQSRHESGVSALTTTPLTERLVSGEI